MKSNLSEEQCYDDNSLVVYALQSIEHGLGREHDGKRLCEVGLRVFGKFQGRSVQVFRLCKLLHAVTQPHGCLYSLIGLKESY